MRTPISVYWRLAKIKLLYVEKLHLTQTFAKFFLQIRVLSLFFTKKAPA
jgi:hypothetical protein